MSQRQLRRRLTSAVGYGPKTLEPILRFQRVVRLGDRGVGYGHIAGLAASEGYADQAHLTREVHRMSGLAPRDLFTARTSSG